MGQHGKHIKVKLYGASFDVLKDVVAAERFLTEAVKAARMRPLDEPWVYDIRKEIEAQGDTPDPSEPEGVTGIVVLSTSHVAIHTWPHRGFAVMDLYSCGDFNTAAVLFVVMMFYRYKRVDVWDLSFSLSMPDLPDDT